MSEIRDPDARSRVETTLIPFLTLRNPEPRSLNLVAEFARKTGDLQVLSRPDLQVLALAYELECERNHGDWRLRKHPGQKGLNGRPTKQDELLPELETALMPSTTELTDNEISEPVKTTRLDSTNAGLTLESDMDSLSVAIGTVDIVTTPQESTSPVPNSTRDENQPRDGIAHVETESSESEGWITPSNLKKHQAKDLGVTEETGPSEQVMQVAVMTTDFAMQNVLLQMNLNLLSPQLQRVRHIRTYILRCHACFEKTKDMSKQFCPRCGKPTLTRVSCSTNANGEFKIHLKKNMQWNNRGDRFSVPKPVGGTASGKVGTGKGGGKGGWGQELILAEDQKEYLQAVKSQNRRKEIDLMDEDYLPRLLTGDRGRAGGRPKIGAGRNVNSKKRR
ncbi:Nin1 binding protein [Loxospora ochrophaea]|nr:Nin1 binding protein [Loxospora ochrophaea]